MPTTYAHYRFGHEALSDMPKEIQTVIGQHPTLFDFGVHGPDLLFYDRPFAKNRVNELGNACHQQTGAEFFTRAAKAQKASQRKDAALSYLVGVLCHFALDRECHPYVAEKERTGASHSEIEASFDRYLLEKDGYDPLRHIVTKHLIPSPASALVIADFYPPLSARDILRAEKSMVFFLNALIAPPGPKRRALVSGMRLSGQGKLEDLLIPLAQNPRCRDSDAILFDRYQAALTRMKALLPELLDYMADGTPLGLGYYHTFGAE